MSTHYINDKNVKARVIIEQPGKSRKPVAGFPFSLVEMLFNSMFDALERSVDKALPKHRKK